MLARRLLTRGGTGAFDPISIETGPDFEFNTDFDGDWVVMDSGWGYVLDVNDTVPGAVYIAGIGGDPSGVGIYRPIPSIPFTVTARISQNTNDASAYSDCGIMLGEATPGKFIHGCWDVAFLGSFRILGSYWSSPTVWVQNIHTAPFDYGVPPASPHYSRFVVNTQDDVDGYFSIDGTSWQQWLDAYNPSFTIGSVGLDLHGSGTSVAVDWLRFT